MLINRSEGILQPQRAVLLKEGRQSEEIARPRDHHPSPLHVPGARAQLNHRISKNVVLK
jgi:hypothetical protein